MKKLFVHWWALREVKNLKKFFANFGAEICLNHFVPMNYVINLNRFQKNIKGNVWLIV